MRTINSLVRSVSAPRHSARALTGVATLLAITLAGCSSGDDSTQDEGGTRGSGGPSGSINALTYNVAGLPQGLSGSDPEFNTPLIAPLLNDFDLVLMQESWETPDPNPTPFRTYHEILEAGSTLAYKSNPLPAPLGSDPERPSAQLSDGLNQFSEFEFDPEIAHVRWVECGDDASDCLATKGFTRSVLTVADGIEVDVYNLHMEAGDEDAALRTDDVKALADYINKHSADRAVIVGGDFNLHIEQEPDAKQFSDLLSTAELSDACTTLKCPEPNRIDKFLFRSSDALNIEPTGWKIPDGFTTEAGEDLSDHLPVQVDFDWSTG